LKPVEAGAATPWPEVAIVLPNPEAARTRALALAAASLTALSVGCAGGGGAGGAGGSGGT
jgi:hypothetical protein